MKEGDIDEDSKCIKTTTNTADAETPDHRTLFVRSGMQRNQF